MRNLIGGNAASGVTGRNLYGLNLKDYLKYNPSSVDEVTSGASLLNDKQLKNLNAYNVLLGLEKQNAGNEVDAQGNRILPAQGNLGYDLDRFLADLNYKTGFNEDKVNVKYKGPSQKTSQNTTV